MEARRNYRVRQEAAVACRLQRTDSEFSGERSEQTQKIC
jgi:hypothetical protein